MSQVSTSIVTVAWSLSMSATNGMVFTNQFCYLTMEDILQAISAMYIPIAPEFHHHKSEEAQGASDIVPYTPSRADILQAISTPFQDLDNTPANDFHGQ